MQIKKALINDRLRISKVSWKFSIPTTYSFTVIYSWNFLFSKKVAYFLTVFLFINKSLRLNNLKTKITKNAKISVLVTVLKRHIFVII